MSKLLRKAREQGGATAVEYALMLALIAMVVIGAVTFLGQATSSQFSRTADCVATACP